jgi:hypothetical protein
MLQPYVLINGAAGHDGAAERIVTNQQDEGDTFEYFALRPKPNAAANRAFALRLRCSIIKRTG